MDPQDMSGRARKISFPPGFYPRTAQPVARCVHCAIPARHRRISNIRTGASHLSETLIIQRVSFIVVAGTAVFPQGKSATEGTSLDLCGVQDRQRERERRILLLTT